MTDTATPETGPVDAPASADSIADTLVAELEAGNGETPVDGADAIAQEMVNEAEGQPGDSAEEPGTEDDATETAEQAEEPEEGTPEEQTYTVKVNGEEREVPLSELLKGYSRTEDYKTKTAAVAEERRQAEAVKANAEADAKAHYASQLEQATQAFADFDPVLQEARKIDWEQLKATNPAAFVQAQDAVQARLQQLEAMKHQVATARQEADQHRQQQEQQARAQRFDQAAEKIVEAMPELADEAKFQSFASDSISYLRNEGFAPEEIADALDHRVLTLADKARRWDAHLAAQKSLPAKKVVQKSAVRALTTDGTSSRATPPRFPSAASRDRKVDWIADAILQEE